VAVPKRKMSRSNTRHRRSQWKATATTLTTTVEGGQTVYSRPHMAKVVVGSDGSVKPKGTVTVVVKGPNGYKTTVTVDYTGQPLNLKLGRVFRTGEYTVKASFEGTANGTFDSSTGRDTFTVKRK
jgi:large subunit ribosomal protein L32